MLLDRCIISTEFEVMPEVVTDRVAYNQNHGTDILDNDPRTRQCDGHDQKTQKLAFGSYGGIVVFTKQTTNGRWFADNIHFNPRHVIYRHNGHRLSVDDYTIALTILREQVAKIQTKPGDSIHIVPGVHPRSKAFWSMLEITADLSDPDGQLEERVFKNPHYPNMKEGFRYRNGMVQIGSSDGPFKVKFYRKDKQMTKLLRKYRIAGAPRIFRVEVAMSQHKLLEHLGSAINTKSIGGKDRLVRFSPVDLIECHRNIMNRLQGCFKVFDGGDLKGKVSKTGRFMALVAEYYNISLGELFDLYETEVGCSKETKGRQRRAANLMMTKISPLNVDEVFSDAAYQQQPSIAIPGLEATVAYRQHVMSNLDIEMTYGRTRPFPIHFA